MKKVLFLMLVVLMVAAFVVPAQACSCKDGKDGADGADGINGINGTNGNDGLNGTAGINGSDADCDNNHYGYGVDIILYEKADYPETKEPWLREISIETRCDLNSGRPIYTGYLVGRVKLWNK